MGNQTRAYKTREGGRGCGGGDLGKVIAGGAGKDTAIRAVVLLRCVRGPRDKVPPPQVEGNVLVFGFIDEERAHSFEVDHAPPAQAIEVLLCRPALRGCFTSTAAQVLYFFRTMAS